MIINITMKEMEEHEELKIRERFEQPPSPEGYGEPKKGTKEKGVVMFFMILTQKN